MDNKFAISQLRNGFLLILILASLTTLVEAVNWSTDIRLTTDEDWDTNPSITQTVNGSIWIVWSSDRAAFEEELFFKTSPDYGLTWTPDTRLTFNVGFDVTPSVVQTANDWLWVVWASDRIGNYELYYKTSSDYGLTWTSDFRLTANASRDLRPSITQDITGTIWVAWSRDVGGGNYELFFKTSSDYGSTWTSDIQLTTHPNLDIWPSIIQTWDGSIWVVWASYRTGDYELFFKTSSDYGSTWSSDIQLTTDTSFDERPSIIQAVDGSIWVVWQSDRAANNYELFFKTSSDYGSTWSSDIRLTDDREYDMSPSVTSTDDGRIWVAWASDRTGEPERNFELFYKFSDVIPVHDVAITDVTLSATNVTGGETVTISAVAENQGTMNETFDVNYYANSTLIGSETITLNPGASTIQAFPWTTPFSTATYIISANATIVPGETDTDDNTFTDGIVNVTRPSIQGDVDGDGDVDLDDLFYILISYGMTIEDAMATYGVPPGTDIDNDGTIDLDDLFYVLRDYGYP